LRNRGSILPLVLLVLALLFVAGPLTLMGRGQLRALRVAVAERQANDLAALALAEAVRRPPGRSVRLRCPSVASRDWRFREVRAGGEVIGEYALLPLRSRRGLGRWCVAARTAGGPLNEGERVAVYYRIVTDARGNVLQQEALR